MFDFPNPNTPPAAKNRSRSSDLLCALLESMVEDMEQSAEDEATRIGAGIALRSTKVKRATDKLNAYALCKFFVCCSCEDLKAVSSGQD